MEAAWRLQGFPFCFRSHNVVNLAIHTKNQQKLILEENKEINALNNWKTTLTAWFELNKNYIFAGNIKYVRIPEYYIFNKINKSWIQRKNIRKNESIGRLNVVSPKDSERFHLKGVCLSEKVKIKNFLFRGIKTVI